MKPHYQTVQKWIRHVVREHSEHRPASLNLESVQSWLKARGFTTSFATKAYEKAEADPRNYNPRSVWGLVQGLTDAAHDIKNTDDRTDIEAKAGSLLDLVA